MKQDVIDIAIIGGGASGLAAAVSAYNFAQLKNKKSKIVIFEKSDKIGKPILKTGNGRCNFSNYFANTEKIKEYKNAKFCSRVFMATQSKLKENQIFNYYQDGQQIAPAFQMFEDLGLACSLEEDGRMYPYTGKASSVVEVFDYAIKEKNISVKTEHELIDVVSENPYKLTFANNRNYFAKKIIICVGGGTFSKRIVGKNFIPRRKVLGAIKTNTKYIKKLDGIRAQVVCSLLDSKNKTLIQETGEALFRKYGLSGICVFNLSRYLKDNSGQKISIDFAADETFESLYETLTYRFEKWQKGGFVNVQRLLAGMMLPELSQSVACFAGIDPNKVTLGDLKNLAIALKCFMVEAYSI